MHANGSVVPLGGKTGNGDNQIKSFGQNGRLVDSEGCESNSSFCIHHWQSLLRNCDCIYSGKSCGQLRIYEFAPGAGPQGLGTDFEATTGPLKSGALRRLAEDSFNPVV
jgi:hypothetical protein